MQAIMIDCKFTGFRRVLEVTPGCQAHLKGCAVDVDLPGSYGGNQKHNNVVGTCPAPFYIESVETQDPQRWHMLIFTVEVCAEPY
jgi:hypothetical protein